MTPRAGQTPQAKGQPIAGFLAPEGLKTVLFWSVLTSAAGILQIRWKPLWPAPLLCAAVLLLVLWFYRDPKRETAAPENALVSPADGKIVEVSPGTTAHTGGTVKIGIFMSPLNVHVNRVPCQGKVVWSRYHPGKKWAASAPKASEMNERYYLGLDTPFGPLAVCQIAGLLARRIRCRAKRGDWFERGDRFGMILLGSKVDLYLPLNAVPTVKVGDKVTAGVTVIAEVEE